jgi:hypothetical protein
MFELFWLPFSHNLSCDKKDRWNHFQKPYSATSFFYFDRGIPPTDTHIFKSPPMEINFHQNISPATRDKVMINMQSKFKLVDYVMSF